VFRIRLETMAARTGPKACNFRPFFAGLRVMSIRFEQEVSTAYRITCGLLSYDAAPESGPAGLSGLKL